MDDAQIGLAGGIAGGIVGVMGAAVGIYFSIKNTNGPRERAMAAKQSALSVAWVAATLALGVLGPRPWASLAVTLNTPLLMAIPRMNRALAAARSEDEAAMG